MNRIIKFRGKVLDVWWYVTPEDDEWEQFWAMVKRETVGQFIGLRDCKGKELYEDDIVATALRWFNKEDDWPLQKQPEKKYRLVKNMGIPLFYAGDWSFQPEDVEVVGNVHENSALLQQEG